VALRKPAFTLIELMIVVAIIGVLAAIAIPKFSALLDKSKEGSTKGALASVRTAIKVYYSDNNGVYPTDDLSSLLVDGRYLNVIPAARIPFTTHPRSANVATAGSRAAMITDAGGWAYVNDSSDPGWGSFAVNCSHRDSGGSGWSRY